jgi:hypothetical protein
VEQEGKECAQQNAWEQRQGAGEFHDGAEV